MKFIPIYLLNIHVYTDLSYLFANLTMIRGRSKPSVSWEGQTDERKKTVIYRDLFAHTGCSLNIVFFP